MGEIKIGSYSPISQAEIEAMKARWAGASPPGECRDHKSWMGAHAPWTISRGWHVAHHLRWWQKILMNLGLPFRIYQASFDGTMKITLDWWWRRLEVSAYERGYNNALIDCGKRTRPEISEYEEPSLFLWREIKKAWSNFFNPAIRIERLPNGKGERKIYPWWWIRREVRGGERYPVGYGVAWQRWECLVAICYPVPLNLLFRWLREAYLLMRNPSGWEWVPEQAMHDKWERGVDYGETIAIKRESADIEKQITQAVRAHTKMLVHNTVKAFKIQPDSIVSIENGDRITQDMRATITVEFRRHGVTGPILFLGSGESLQVHTVSPGDIVALKSEQEIMSAETQRRMTARLSQLGFSNPVVCTYGGDSIEVISEEQMRSTGWVRINEAVDTIEKVFAKR